MSRFLYANLSLSNFYFIFLFGWNWFLFILFYFNFLLILNFFYLFDGNWDGEKCWEISGEPKRFVAFLVPGRLSNLLNPPPVYVHEYWKRNYFMFFFLNQENCYYFLIFFPKTSEILGDAGIFIIFQKLKNTQNFGRKWPHFFFIFLNNFFILFSCTQPRKIKSAYLCFSLTTNFNLNNNKKYKF
jgi:hypothetical protein